MSHADRIGVFVIGLLFIVLGFALAVLPQPLTIPARPDRPVRLVERVPLRPAVLSSRRPDVAVRPVVGAPGRTVEVVLLSAERRSPSVAAAVAALREAAHVLAAEPASAALGLRPATRASAGLQMTVASDQVSGVEAFEP